MSPARLATDTTSRLLPGLVSVLVNSSTIPNPFRPPIDGNSGSHGRWIL